MASEDLADNREQNEYDFATSAPEPNESRVGSIIGPYHLLELIGEGGMGLVWLAEQREPVRRRVALKLIKAGMDTRDVVARFQSERQALALMDHPAIAKVFDAGSTPNGRPYFVMEYVAGLPITTYADKHKLTTRQRLELFMLVCDGVQHAHQKAIIHRDLKPSNVLVNEIDGNPKPRIIDFGVAKAASQQLNAGTAYTKLGSMIGTMDYMSPEQADSGGEGIDTRTDVYSLGVVLYELLVGALPLDFNKVAYNEFLRVLREEEPQRPSTRLSTMGGESATAAKNRHVDPTTLSRQLRGDPDAITLKALEKDRKRRYGSPSELAADIAHCLRNEPVTARPPSFGYRTGKYIRRYWPGVSVASAVVLLLVGFAIAQTIALRRITLERDRADRVTKLMTNMFKVADPIDIPNNSVTAREILDKASNGIKTGLSTDPETQAKMMYTVAESYVGLGMYERAQSLDEQAVELQMRVLGPRNPDTLRSKSALASVLRMGRQYSEAEKLDRETLDIRRRVLGPLHPDTLASTRNLADDLTVTGSNVEAETLLRGTLEAQRRTRGSDDPETLISMQSLASALSFKTRTDDEAEALEREVVEIQSRTLGPENPNTLKSMNELSGHLKNDAEAEKLYRATLEIQRRVLGPEHMDTAFTMYCLANLLTREGRYAEAEEMYRQTVLIYQRVLGPEHPTTLILTFQLADVIGKDGRYAEAEKLYRGVIDVDRRVRGQGSWIAFDAGMNLDGILTDEAAKAKQAQPRGKPHRK
jgi:serine/threonine protein kinase